MHKKPDRIYMSLDNTMVEMPSYAELLAKIQHVVTIYLISGYSWCRCHYY